MTRRLLEISCIALTLSGCAAGAGPGGIGALVGKKTLSAAEPLFGFDSQRCFKNAGFMLRILQPAPAATKSDDVCEQLIIDLKGAIDAPAFGQANVATPAKNGPKALAGTSSSAQIRRNEVVDGLIAESNRKCSSYTSFLKSYDGSVNSSLSFVSLLTGGLGAFVGGVQTAKALSGSSAIVSGTRSSLNEIHFTNQTIQVLASAFEKARRDQRREIGNREQCGIEHYSIMRGIEDAIDYHRSCSIVTGLSEAGDSVKRSENPGVETMRLALAEMTSLRRQADAFSKDGSIEDVPTADRENFKLLDAKAAADEQAKRDLWKPLDVKAIDSEKKYNDMVASGVVDTSILDPLRTAAENDRMAAQLAHKALDDARNARADMLVKIIRRSTDIRNTSESAQTQGLRQISYCPFTAVTPSK
jgi:hypothetical protein